jgi:hypothetical protein
VWDLDEDAALTLAGLVEAHLLAAPGLVAGVTYATSFLGPTATPDPDDDSAAHVLLTVTWQVGGTQQ